MTVEFLRKNGCRVILVRMPEGPAFRSWYAPNLAQVEAKKFRSFLLPEAKDWIDAREWFEEDKFWDSNHLNPKGAQIFSERLAREILWVANDDK
jgi:lysophospholipase L1-like esterase